MNPFQIKSVSALEVLDSRGNPTVEAVVTTFGGVCTSAISPSGASTGSKEACELRDGGSRYLGKGVKNAVSNVNNIIAKHLVGLDCRDQQRIDEVMIALDGTENKSNLGANAILAVSMAVLKAGAVSSKMPLYRYIGGVNSVTLPLAMMNIVNGGKHASNGLAIQEYMIAPHNTTSFAESLRMGAEVFHHLKKVLSSDGFSTNVGDEGGFAPDFNDTDQVISYIEKAVLNAGYKFGEDIKICLDAASSEFYENGKYEVDGKSLSSDELIRYYEDICQRFPIISIEDPLSEDDYDGFVNITKALGSKVTLVGDDLFCTNPKLLKELSAKGMCNSILIKPNQIGTVSETLETIRIAKSKGYGTIISHRSGESEDTTISHIAVGTNAGWIKTGSLSRADRTAKYNELLRIEHNIHSS